MASIQANKAKSTKRQAPSVLSPACQWNNHQRRIKPKRLVLDPQSSGNDTNENTLAQEKDAFEFVPLEFYWNLSTRRKQRPLPAITSILAVAQHQHHRASANITSDAGDDGEIIDGDTGKNASELKRQECINEKSGKNMPLLTDFFTKIRKQINPNGEENDVEKDTNESNEDASSIVTKKLSSPLDVISKTLTLGHHKRFNDLLSELETNGSLSHNHHNRNTKKRRYFPKNPAREKEFSKLCQLFREERRLYGLAWDSFRQENVDRFLIGFNVHGPASSFVYTNSQRVKLYKEQWRKNQEEQPLSQLPLKYGTSRQNISLQVSSSSSYYNETESTRVDMNTFSPKIVSLDDDKVDSSVTTPKMNNLPTLSDGWKESLLGLSDGGKLHPPECQSNQEKRGKSTPTANSNLSLLCNDITARKLAIKHKANIVITSDALKTLMVCPGKFTSRWVIPFFLEELSEGTNIKPTQNHQQFVVTFVEDPLPQQSTPRECLMVGFTEALYNQAASMDPKNAKTSTENTHHKNHEHVYTLLMLDHPTVRKSKHKILVRSINRLQDANGNPVHLKCHLEYFAERQVFEGYSSMDRAIWLLVKILQPNSVFAICHVDPNSACLLKVEEKNLADALVVGDNLLDRRLDVLGPFQDIGSCEGVSKHFQLMVDVIHGLKMMNQAERGNFLVCLPGRGQEGVSHSTTASIHKALMSPASDPNHIGINLEKDLSEADSVSLGGNILFECFQFWQWKDNRTAFTFPLNDSSPEV